MANKEHIEFIYDKIATSVSGDVPYVDTLEKFGEQFGITNDDEHMLVDIFDDVVAAMYMDNIICIDQETNTLSPNYRA